jgi:membrane protein implicated in regulation of membrane protease activity
VLDLGIDLNVWPWVWLGIAVVFAIVELTALAGSFVLLPFAVSAFAASLLGFYDVPIEVQWFVFAVGGGVLWILLYRYAKRFAGENELQPGVGADRLIGLEGIVTTAIDPDDTDRRGRVTAHGEIWGAISASGRVLPVGTHVRVTAVNGTKVVVESTESTAEDTPSTPPTIPPTSPPPPSPPSSSPPTPPPPPSSTT